MFLNSIKGQVSRQFRQGTGEKLNTSVDPSVAVERHRPFKMRATFLLLLCVVLLATAAFANEAKNDGSLAVSVDEQSDKLAGDVLGDVLGDALGDVLGDALGDDLSGDAVKSTKVGVHDGNRADYTAGVRIISPPAFACRRYWRVVEAGLGLISHEHAAGDGVYSLSAN
ncbi:hypothetical protein LSAT2_021984 [Lamellibrachia satsuma]|nr:hypothetical protein LSAT2_021984 [Lamellibrachia satsuma]